MVKCPKCGTEIRNRKLVCSQCGCNLRKIGLLGRKKKKQLSYIPIDKKTDKQVSVSKSNQNKAAPEAPNNIIHQNQINTQSSKNSSIKNWFIWVAVALITLAGISFATYHVLASQGQKASSAKISKNIKSKKVTRKARKITKKTKSKKATPKKAQPKKILVWNDQKAKKLNDLMYEFGTKMNQKYSQYNGEDPLTTSGKQVFPNIFNEAKFKLNNANSDNLSIGWNPEVDKNNPKFSYNVVAIYNYNKNEQNHITYLFCYHNGDGLVLCDQAPLGKEIIVQETRNRDLKDGFNQIIND